MIDPLPDLEYQDKEYGGRNDYRRSVILLHHGITGALRWSTSPFESGGSLDHIPSRGIGSGMQKTIAHQTHPEIVKRLKRAEGHLRRVVAMVEEGRPCVDLAQQLQAVEKAIGEAKKTLIHDHIDHCLDAAANRRGTTARSAVSEFRTISKYL